MLKRNYIEDIRDEFRRLKRHDRQVNGTYEIRGASFVADAPTIFGKRNEAYVDAELEWYLSQSLNVNDIELYYGMVPKIWETVSTPSGEINSNYGWMVFSEDNHNQYNEALMSLKRDNNSRQSCIYYTRPTMHKDSTRGGMRDHTCTFATQHFGNNDGYLETHVYMRSNDAIFGFINDLAWQRYVHFKLAQETGLIPGPIYWNAGSLHVYERHWHLIV